MSKKDQLGRGSSFGSTSNRSARRNAINETINGGVGTADLTDLPVPAISDNPDNPRNHLRNLEYTVESVREVGVILPIVVGTVDAYVRSRPDRANDLDPGAQYVVIDGHRRLEAARQVGLATIPVRVDDARLSSDEKLLESAFIANYHREDMTDLEEAHALKQLVDYYGGSQTKACRRLSMSASTLSSKLSLLKLSPELQKDLMTGERKTEHVRNLSKLSPEAQKAKADERAEASKRRARSRQQPAPEPADFHAVKNHSEVTAGVLEQLLPAADGQDPPKESIPEPRGAEGRDGQQDQSAVKKFPYHDGFEAGTLILFKMPPEERDKVCDMLLRDREKRAANAD
ncbi:plasmid partitioning protein [Streptomyces avermitilis]|uniref:Plasmid partitioning protein, ParB nuclease n=2 Tax=Streptomyces avermitilis TaxID=33903 RepID=Q82YB1_STRAW|nr:ParB/RepB/Spo0J family partition protein [Streptomyces avermitilis]KUN48765.1 plasmid partitioning protein [Streptomyces avermitilis]OOV24659.1 plasmid partitioning protein [Streptomyces avermitilis]BAC75354.1 putative plasmid partitioning protein, ParB nuclease [Streptomyces avermitilis MA-4680 = NBRC 14893]BBJ56378.1 plasmid partitioning protein [Streptomyces avermitilis]GDY70411.1 plasmid partitioning protein [Streptomyces avermitilis]